MYTFESMTTEEVFSGTIIEVKVVNDKALLTIDSNYDLGANVVGYAHNFKDFSILDYIEQTLGVDQHFIGGKYNNMYDFIAYRKYTRPSYIQKMINLLLPLIEQVELDPEISIEYETMQIRFPVTILRELVQK